MATPSGLHPVLATIGLPTLTVFVTFALLHLKEPLKLDYLWAGLCMLGAVTFRFRGR